MDNSDIYVIFMFSNFFFGENARPSRDVKNTISADNSAELLNARFLTVE